MEMDYEDDDDNFWGMNNHSTWKVKGDLSYLFPDPDGFMNCKHTRKEEYGEFHRCADCRYHFCNDDLKYSHPDQYKNCEHLRKDDVFGKLTCFRCGLRFGTVFSTCEHRRKKRFFDYSDFYCCADCGYHFVDGNPKFRHPSQYEDCEHSHKEKNRRSNYLLMLRT